MEFKGTKGKWFIDEDKWIVTDDKSEFGDIICAPPEEWDLSIIKWNANALLISKAPEMLEMLQMLNNIENEEFCKESFNVEDLKRKLSRLIKEATELN